MCDTAATILSEAGMHLRKWTTNSRELRRVADEMSMHPDTSTSNRRTRGRCWVCSGTQKPTLYTLKCSAWFCSSCQQNGLKDWYFKRRRAFMIPLGLYRLL
ncbi:unnamed protein product [Ixodes pacificus]